MLRSVRLWGIPDVALIVAESSGIVYQNQVMGHACVQAAAEGILVPLVPDYPIDERGRPAVDTLGERLGRAVHLARWLSDAEADAVDAILGGYRETRGVLVDRRRLEESGEAWIYVCVVPNEDGPMEGFGPVEGVITWHNSD